MEPPLKYGLLFLASAVGCVVAARGLEWSLRFAYRKGLRTTKEASKVSGRTARIVYLLSIFLAVGVGIGLSWVLTGRLIFGLGGLIFVPFLFRWGIRWVHHRRRDVLDGSALSFFYSLQGLIEVGVSFPSALFQLSKSLPAPFASVLEGFLSDYEEGKSLPSCLTRFRRKTELDHSSVWLSLLEGAYRNGFPVGPILERMLPMVEVEIQCREREKSLRRSALTQLAFAVLVPWLLGGVLHVFQPGILNNFVHSSLLVPVLLIVVFSQLLGGYLLWRVSRFC